MNIGQGKTKGISAKQSTKQEIDSFYDEVRPIHQFKKEEEEKNTAL